jgi:secondary thiamine-phosphate synthase enzyme
MGLGSAPATETAQLNGSAHFNGSVSGAVAVDGMMRSVTRVIDVASNRHTEFVDVTDAVAAVVASSGVADGFAVINSQHTTARIHVNEHEPLLLADVTALLERVVPRDAFYHHDDFSVRTVNLTPGERVNGHSHARGLFIPVSEHLPITNGALMLGRWQRIFLLELDGPQTRQVVVKVMGVASA